MIKLYEDNIGLVSVKITGNGDFKKCLRLVKDLPVRIYRKENKRWKIPYNEIPSLIKLCKENGIDIKGEPKVISNLKDHKAWKTSQLQYKKSDDIFSEMDLLKKEMYPYQTIGAKFIYEAGNGIIMDVVGLGKTIQSLSVACKHFEDDNINFFIVICPNTLKRNWESEIKKFTDKNITVVSGSKSQRKKIYKEAYRCDGLVINYESLIYDIDIIDKYIFEKSFRFMLILDEIQYIKNSTAKRSKLVKIISQHATCSVGLSATVIENSLLDLWSVFHAINKNVLGSEELYINFVDRYCYKDWFGSIIIDLHHERDEEKRKLEKWTRLYERDGKDTFKRFMYSSRDKLAEINTKIGRLKELNVRIDPYTIRRFKEDVFEQLPERIENNYWIKLSSVQGKFYDEVVQKIVGQISDMEKAGKISMAKILPMITYLRQCALSSKLIGHEDNISTKLDELLKLMESLDKKSKVLIFCTYVKMVDLIGEALENKGYKNIAIHGQNCKNADDRFRYVEEFNSFETGYRALVTSDILREGMNITSANYIVNFDILWNPAKMEQRIGRADRIGNKWDVINVINFIAEDTIEEHIFAIQEGKKKLSDSVINDNRIESRMTFKNIKSLFNIK